MVQCSACTVPRPEPSLLPHNKCSCMLISMWTTSTARHHSLFCGSIRHVPRAPTYVLSECVLVYMEPQHSAAVVRWAAGAFPNAVMAIYEQVCSWRERGKVNMKAQLSCCSVKQVLSILSCSYLFEKS